MHSSCEGSSQLDCVLLNKYGCSRQRHAVNKGQHGRDKVLKVNSRLGSAVAHNQIASLLQAEHQQAVPQKGKLATQTGIMCKQAPPSAVLPQFLCMQAIWKHDVSAFLLQAQQVDSRGTWPSWARAVHSPTASSAGTSVPPRRITLLTASMMRWLGQKRNAARACMAARSRLAS